MQMVAKRLVEFFALDFNPPLVNTTTNLNPAVMLTQPYLIPVSEICRYVQCSFLFTKRVQRYVKSNKTKAKE